MHYITLTLILILLTIIPISATRFGFISLFLKKPTSRQGNIHWEDKGPTPLGEKKYTPQGITWINGKIIFANTWKNTRSRVYEFHPATMKILRTFDMPEGAVHTSGLAFDGTYLWGVDYRSNRAYCIDLELSLVEGEVKLIGSFETSLKGTSACCIIPWEGDTLLAISDFMNSRQTIFVKMIEALKAGTAAGNIVFTYKNEGFSQGLEYFDGFLYESENKAGKNIVNKMNPKLLRETHDARKSIVVQYPAPGSGVEDLAWDGDGIWTSDEHVFKFFRGVFK
ncbi:hypothetical protein K8I28_16430 [bacterium]|nr:hypothetical protein [bacterium]